MAQDDTFVDPQTPTRSSAKHDAQPARPSGYDLGGVIGRGGMGEVVLARDPRLQRDVAIKRMLSRDPTLTARFLREARIQARLEHPAIVPVHEVGQDSDGRPYFTMKRVSGVTLDQMIPTATTQRMLRAFIDVCHAIELAHSEGIVHRDLKPANIMLGNFGEVYVIDWGVARELLSDADTPFDDTAKYEGETLAGALLGTPGYMAPEQARGEQIGPAADVYALGCILFEILTRECVHSDPQRALETTLEVTDSPGGRRPDLAIAPELDAACADALSLEAQNRPTAAVLANRVQSYLDGDRDLERRRLLHAEQLRHALGALAAGDRALAMHCAGRALALDPKSEDAAGLVGQLMLEPPRHPPPELRAELGATDAAEIRRHAIGATAAFLSLIPLVPIAHWNGITNWSAAIAYVLGALVMAGLASLVVRRPLVSRGVMVGYLTANACFAALIGYVVGPLLFGPVAAGLITMSLVFYPQFAGRAWLVVTLIICGWGAPLVLERAGVLASMWSITDGQLSMTPTALDFNASTTPVLLVTLEAILIALGGFLANMYVRGHRDAKHQLVTQAWHLRQLLPRR